jgi:hypothetical protein
MSGARCSAPSGELVSAAHVDQEHPAVLHPLRQRLHAHLLEACAGAGRISAVIAG